MNSLGSTGWFLTTGLPGLGFVGVGVGFLVEGGILFLSMDTVVWGLKERCLVR